MGFMSPDLPDVDRHSWQNLPRATRLQIVTRHWVDNGFGTPYAVYLLYLLKIAVYIAAQQYVMLSSRLVASISHAGYSVTIASSSPFPLAAGRKTLEAT